MIISADKEMRFYKSSNLKKWDYVSAFGKGLRNAAQSVRMSRLCTASCRWRQEQNEVRHAGKHQPRLLVRRFSHRVFRGRFRRKELQVRHASERIQLLGLRQRQLCHRLFLRCSGPRSLHCVDEQLAVCQHYTHQAVSRRKHFAARN